MGNCVQSQLPQHVHQDHNFNVVQTSLQLKAVILPAAQIPMTGGLVGPSKQENHQGADELCSHV
jgi:hypothetical protein